MATLREIHAGFPPNDAPKSESGHAKGVGPFLMVAVMQHIKH
ncbi:hypothetical protein M2337_000311 [Sphingobium sp. B2D3A]|nr:hypothetical protein [Sphingobium sp. B2D3A]